MARGPARTPSKAEAINLIDWTEREITEMVAIAVDRRPVVLGDRLAVVATRLYDFLRRARRRPLPR